MGNLEHPIDGAIIELSALRRDLEAEFLDDGILCKREAALLTRLTENKRRIGRARALARATELAMKQEGEFTDYTKRQFALAGVRITPIEPDAA